MKTVTDSGTPQKLSVVVNYFNPSLNRRLFAMLCFCLRCVADHTKSQLEVILADGTGCPSPELESLCNDVRAIYAPSEVVESFAQTYNRGLRLATGEYIALMASDIFVPLGWDLPLLNELLRTNAWMVAPYLSFSDYPSQRRHWVLRRYTFAPSSLTFNLNLMTGRCLKSVGELNERLTGGFNDIDYLIRIRNRGGEVVIADAGEVVHYGKATLRVATSHNWQQDLDVFRSLYPALPRNASYAGVDPILCRSRAYASGLRLLRLCSSPGRRKAILTNFARLEPLFHRV